MEGLFAVLLGACAVAAAPFVPALRPVAKAAVKGSLALADVATGAAALTGYAVNQVVQSVSSARQAAGEAVVPESGEPSATAEAEVMAEAAAESPTEAEAMTEVEATVEATIDDVQADLLQEHVMMAASEMDDEIERTSDLILVNGIGPKVAAVLEAAGVTTMEQLAAMDEAQLREILADAGSRYRAMDPSTWPAQARQLLESALYSVGVSE